MTEGYDVTYPHDRGLCKELQRFADDCGKWRATRIQSLVARARARIIDLQAVLRNGVELADLDAAQSVVNELTMKLKRERERAERLREAVTWGLTLRDARRGWAAEAEFAQAREGNSGRAKRFRAIANALEVEETEKGAETEPPEEEGDSTADLDDLVYGMILDDMEERGVIPPLEVPSEQEADAEQPCPHEQAEWAKARQGRPAGWVMPLSEQLEEFLGGPGEDCPICGKPLPPKPAELLTWEECWERLPASVCIDHHPDGSYWAYGRDDDDWSTYQATGQSVLAALRALVEAVEEKEVRNAD